MSNARKCSTDDFQSLVREIVAPLLVERGLVIAEADPRSVRFESTDVWALVFHEEWSDAIGFHFDLLNAPTEHRWFLTSDAMRLVDRPAAAQYLDYTAHTDEQVRLGLQRLRRNIEAYCTRALTGEAAIFDAMTQARDRRLAQQYAWQQRCSEMGLNAAVERRDWERVIKIYGTAEQDFGVLTQRKLEVAVQNLRTQRAHERGPLDDPLFADATIHAYREYLPQDGSDDEHRNLELEVGDAMDADDWTRVVALYESAAEELDYLQQKRLEIARRRIV